MKAAKQPSPLVVRLANSRGIAIIDDDWEEDVLGNGQKWHLSSEGYAESWVNPKNTFLGYRRIFMHNLIMGENPGFLVDHINGNRLDNRTANLRFVNRYQHSWNSSISSRNTSGCKGVNYENRSRKWRVRMTVNGKEKWLGLFQTFGEACVARKEAETKFHGEYARKD